MTLNEVQVGGVCVVTKLNGEGMELNVRGYELSIRKNEAESIEVR